ncbi:MAG TPA: YdeI/OmpD-associated family protein [Candidatus Acidoferrales bacterium]|nr:YdeI/OmpD-associated family protein [Candidatus Acidoferrales bacterium]
MKTLYVRNRAEWRSWLRRNANTSDEVWLLYYKKTSGKPRIAYDDAVEEALCFGWIDSTLRSIDAARYAQRFTPRKPQSRWSRLNIERAKKLIAAGMMTPAGLQAFSPQARRETPPKPRRLPTDLAHQFRMQSDAWKHFQRFPPGYRRITIEWVASAKKEGTRVKRLQQLIESSARNERIKFM